MHSPQQLQLYKIEATPLGQVQLLVVEQEYC